MILNDTGFAFGHAHCFRLREELLRLNERLTTHRLLRGAVVPGGVAEAGGAPSLKDVAKTVERLVTEFVEIVGVCLANTTVLERLQGTGRLTTPIARGMQVVGLVGRASGIDADARRDAPFAAYAELEVRVPVYAEGDVWARTMVRLDEASGGAAPRRAAGRPGRGARGSRSQSPPAPRCAPSRGSGGSPRSRASTAAGPGPGTRPSIVAGIERARACGAVRSDGARA